MTRYIDTKETAALVRKAVARAFPGVKFSVRISRYSGGSSITVGWTDGPTDKQVSQVTGQFQGARFDGSIDMAFTVQHWLLPDGSAITAKSPGTTGSKGYYEPIETAKPAGAELVSFGSTYVHTRREISAGMMQRALDKVMRCYTVPEAAGVKVVISKYGTATLSSDPRIADTNDWLSSLVHRECRRRATTTAA